MRMQTSVRSTYEMRSRGEMKTRLRADRNDVLKPRAAPRAHHRAMTVKLAIVAALAACDVNVRPPANPTNVYVSSEAHANASSEMRNTVDTSDITDIPCADCGPPPPPMTPRARVVQVFVDKRIPRPTEVVGVLDFHSAATNEDKGFDELRARAAALGADAVIGAEFEHGEGGEPSHLSGMAVRFLDNY
jgi:hypothetical protein